MFSNKNDSNAINHKVNLTTFILGKEQKLIPTSYSNPQADSGNAIYWCSFSRQEGYWNLQNNTRINKCKAEL